MFNYGAYQPLNSIIVSYRDDGNVRESNSPTHCITKFSKSWRWLAITSTQASIFNRVSIWIRTATAVTVARVRIWSTNIRYILFRPSSSPWPHESSPKVKANDARYSINSTLYRWRRSQQCQCIWMLNLDFYRWNRSSDVVKLYFTTETEAEACSNSVTCTYLSYDEGSIMMSLLDSTVSSNWQWWMIQ